MKMNEKDRGEIYRNLSQKEQSLTESGVLKAGQVPPHPVRAVEVKLRRRHVSVLLTPRRGSVTLVEPFDLKGEAAVFHLRDKRRTPGTMKKLRTTLIVSLFGSAILLALSAQSTRSQTPVSKASNANCAIKFHTLSRYKDEAWRVFSDREVAPALRILLKRDYQLLKESLQRVTYPDSLSFLDKDGVLTLEGGAQHLFTIMEAKLIIEPCGNIYALILNEGKRFLYFTNDRKYIDKLPPAIEEWRIDVESRRSQPSELPKLPVVFKDKLNH
jgi:hypothetical protein